MIQLSTGDFFQLKPCQNKKGRKFILDPPKMTSFSQLPSVKKTPFLVQLKQIFGPSYFDRALVHTFEKESPDGS